MDAHWTVTMLFVSWQLVVSLVAIILVWIPLDYVFSFPWMILWICCSGLIWYDFLVRPSHYLVLLSSSTEFVVVGNLGIEQYTCSALVPSLKWSQFVYLFPFFLPSLHWEAPCLAFFNARHFVYFLKLRCQLTDNMTCRLSL